MFPNTQSVLEWPSINEYSSFHYGGVNFSENIFFGAVRGSKKPPKYPHIILDGLEFLRFTLNNWPTTNVTAILFWPLEGLQVCYLFLLNCVAPPY